MIEQGIKLSAFSNYKIGGPARFFFKAENVKEVIGALDEWRRFVPNRNRETDSGGIFVLGGGTNILFEDEGFGGLVLKPDFRKMERIGEFSIRAGAGVPMAELTDYFLENGFSGLEWAGGLPGTLGGAIRGNAGAFGGEIKDIIEEVVSLDISSRPKITKRKKEDCDFSYRSSVFKKQSPSGIDPEEIIVEAVLNLEKGDKKLMRDIAQKNVDYRKERQPLEHPNIGSIFKNVSCEKAGKEASEKFKSEIKTDPFPVIPAAYLISEAGLKGISFGGAMISPKHPNFIVNVVNASANDVKKLIDLAKSEIKNKFGLDLEEEIVMFRQF